LWCSPQRAAGHRIHGPVGQEAAEPDQELRLSAHLVASPRIGCGQGLEHDLGDLLVGELGDPSVDVCVGGDVEPDRLDERQPQ
jgi:hypothetical protein